MFRRSIQIWSIIHMFVGELLLAGAGLLLVVGFVAVAAVLLA